ncbi:glycogen synthase GlgA [Aeoliella mucimassa]|uniref:Glycogen synthase n=1 Tax=Aeoliella mucimassa TaxID=2527972 RepID=A0A518AHY1_9BACT|nr:glycogen synthase GlgA [Aeoliella mucimassa]QDU54329.1 Glycogen synthase [Aeoliella mucimassa]
MNVLFVSAEAVPFAKTGGLGDICGSLPRELAARGVRCTLVMPAFRQALNCGQPIEPTGVEIVVPIAGRPVKGRLLKSTLPDSDVTVYLVDHPGYYDRAELYREDGEDYKDNCERFVFFNRAVLEVIERFVPDTQLLHAHDWTSALSTVYLRTERGRTVDYSNIATLFTIHNLAYQGSFWHWDMELTGLDWKYFNWQQMEFYGKLNFLKSALVFADTVSTVSPTYAKEIQHAEHGCGLEGVLQDRAEDLFGVLNGCDYGAWNPETDPFIAQQYSSEYFVSGKAACKQALQQELGLPTRPEMPMISIVGRLADQKGFDLIAPLIETYAQRNAVQWAILGTGEPKYHTLLTELAARYPEQVGVRLEFSNPLAHRLEAGGDFFLMPSRYEPCGLNQMYSLRYGTVPIVRATGGLADTITDATDHALNNGTANGFSFFEYNSDALGSTIERALSLYRSPDPWRRLVRTGMNQDWSWRTSAEQYLHVYEETMSRLPTAV